MYIAQQNKMAFTGDFRKDIWDPYRFLNNFIEIDSTVYTKYITLRKAVDMPDYLDTHC